MSGQKMPTRKELEQTLKEIRNIKEVFETTQTEMSFFLFTKYESLQKSGFTKEQAFEIILRRGLD